MPGGGLAKLRDACAPERTSRLRTFTCRKVYYEMG